MGFKPLKQQHAIAEVVFGVTLARPWEPRELAQIEAGHEAWREVLPRMSKVQSQQLLLNDQTGLPSLLPQPGLVFESFQPNGEVAWRLACQANTMFLNCLVYSRWAEVWGKAREIMAQVAAVGMEEHEQGVLNLQLQYIDIFEWDGPIESYDSRELVREDSDFISNKIAAGNIGHLWHHYSGWFETWDEPTPGKILNRVHIDAVETDDGKPFVRFDAVLRKDFVSPLSVATLVQGPTVVDEIFTTLHEKNKNLMADYLTGQVLRLIGIVK